MNAFALKLRRLARVGVFCLFSCTSYCTLSECPEGVNPCCTECSAQDASGNVITDDINDG